MLGFDFDSSWHCLGVEVGQLGTGKSLEKLRCCEEGGEAGSRLTEGMSMVWEMFREEGLQVPLCCGPGRLQAGPSMEPAESNLGWVGPR